MPKTAMSTRDVVLNASSFFSSGRDTRLHHPGAKDQTANLSLRWKLQSHEHGRYLSSLIAPGRRYPTRVDRLGRMRNKHLRRLGS